MCGGIAFDQERAFWQLQLACLRRGWSGDFRILAGVETGAEDLRLPKPSTASGVLSRGHAGTQRQHGNAGHGQFHEFHPLLHLFLRGGRSLTFGPRRLMHLQEHWGKSRSPGLA